jgi:hypothetical protein
VKASAAFVCDETVSRLNFCATRDTRSSAHKSATINALLHDTRIINSHRPRSKAGEAIALIIRGSTAGPRWIETTYGPHLDDIPFPVRDARSLRLFTIA